MTTRNLIPVLWACLYATGCSQRAPAGSSGCVDSVTLLTPGSDTRVLNHSCGEGQEAVLTIAPNNSVVVKCVCSKPVPDAGLDAPSDG